MYKLIYLVWADARLGCGVKCVRARLIVVLNQFKCCENG